MFNLTAQTLFNTIVIMSCIRMLLDIGPRLSTCTSTSCDWMDENCGSRPLLGNQNHDGNSFNSLRTAFLFKLPDNDRSGLDSESPFQFDHQVSSTNHLSQGLSLISLLKVKVALCVRACLHVLWLSMLIIQWKPLTTFNVVRLN